MSPKKCLHRIYVYIYLNKHNLDTSRLRAKIAKNWKKNKTQQWDFFLRSLSRRQPQEDERLFNKNVETHWDNPTEVKNVEPKNHKGLSTDWSLEDQNVFFSVCLFVFAFFFLLLPFCCFFLSLLVLGVFLFSLSFSFFICLSFSTFRC